MSGLGGVWAEENTRESIFAAMQRKETFGTSGPRIKVRLFGGWDFSPDVLKQADWVKAGYASGVPMGGDLPPPKGKAPTFIVWAVKDPDGANLDRIQVVKGWTKNGQIFEKIYDVGVVGKSGAHAEQQSDPECSLRRQRADAAAGRQHGRHQERHVREHDRRGGIEDRLDGSGLRSEPARLLLRAGGGNSRPRAGPPTTPRPWACRRRAMCPAAFRNAPGPRRSGTRRRHEMRAQAPHGMTVADLMQRGATPLDDAQLRALIVGKTVAVRNTVTNQRFEITYGVDGRAPDLEHRWQAARS